MTRGTVWVIGVLGIVVLWGAAVAWKARPIERQIAVGTVNELKRLGLDRRFEALSLQIEGRDLTLSGTALSEEDRARALAAAASTPGVRNLVDRIAVAPLARPFVFRAVRNADAGVTLDGDAPSAEMIDRLVELGRSLYGRDLRVSLRVARGAPEGDWFAAAKLAIQTVAFIERGEAVLSDRRLALKGRAPHDGALDAVRTALARSVPAGYAAASELLTALDEELRASPLTAVKDCQALFDKVTKDRPVYRDPRIRPGIDPARMLGQLALAARRCGSLYIEVHGYSPRLGGDPVGIHRASEAKARAVADELIKHGISRERITAIGHGPGLRGQRADEVELRISDAATPVLRPFVWIFEKRGDGDGALSGHHPTADAAKTLAKAARASVSGKVADTSRLGHGAPAGDWLAAAELAIAALAKLEQGWARLSDAELTLRGIAKDDAAQRDVEALLAARMPRDFKVIADLSTGLDEELKRGEIADTQQCQTLFDTVAQTGTVEFVFDGPALLGHQRLLFKRLAAAARRCQRFIVEIGAHSSGIGDPEAARALSERWAQAVAEALAGAGAERRWLRAIGFGNTRPLADGNTEAGRLRNRRIAFRIVTIAPQ